MEKLVGLFGDILAIAIFIHIVLKIWIYSELLNKILYTLIVFFIGLFFIHLEFFYKK